METPSAVVSDPPPARTSAGAVSRSSAALAGVVAGGLAIGLSEWTSGIAKGVPSLVASVGQTTIDWSPGSIVHLGIRLLGHDDKAFVVAMVLLDLCGGGGGAGNCPPAATVGGVGRLLSVRVDRGARRGAGPPGQCRRGGRRRDLLGRTGCRRHGSAVEAGAEARRDRAFPRSGAGGAEPNQISSPSRLSRRAFFAAAASAGAVAVAAGATRAPARPPGGSRQPAEGHPSPRRPAGGPAQPGDVGRGPRSHSDRGEQRRFLPDRHPPPRAACSERRHLAAPDHRHGRPSTGAQLGSAGRPCR